MHALSLVVLVATSLLASFCAATCPTYSQISLWVVDCHQSPGSTACLEGAATGSTSCSSSFIADTSCNKTLEQIYAEASADCTTALSAITSIYPPAHDCTEQNFTGFAKQSCNAGFSCPTATNYDSLLSLANCLLTTPQQLQANNPSALASYSAYSCLQAKENTAGVPTECQSQSVLTPFLTCQQSTEQVVSNILGDNSTGACTIVLVGPLSQYCYMNFGAAIEAFCTPSFCQQSFPGSDSLSMCAGIGVVAGVVGGVIALAGAGYLFYRRREKQKEAAAAMYGGSPPSQSPGFTGFSSPGMSQQSSFGQLVPPPPGIGGYFQPGYSQQAPGLSATSPIPASQALDPATLTVRKGQLCDFYLFHDPTRENIPEHVDKLFDKYSFENILSAVQSKYGVAPPGWAT